MIKLNKKVEPEEKSKYKELVIKLKKKVEPSERSIEKGLMIQS